jgi:hypothetical protein
LVISGGKTKNIKAFPMPLDDADNAVWNGGLTRAQMTKNLRNRGHPADRVGFIAIMARGVNHDVLLGPVGGVSGTVAGQSPEIPGPDLAENAGQNETVSWMDIESDGHWGCVFPVALPPKHHNPLAKSMVPNQWGQISPSA